MHLTSYKKILALFVVLLSQLSLLAQDLKVNKLALKYGYKLSDTWDFSAYYLNVLDDNILDALDGKVYV